MAEASPPPFQLTCLFSVIAAPRRDHEPPYANPPLMSYIFFAESHFRDTFSDLSYVELTFYYPADFVLDAVTLPI
jgi:hypothetical protein